MLWYKDSKNYTFEKFKLDTSSISRLKPVEQQILIQHLRTAEREQLLSDYIVFEDQQFEDFIVTELINFNDISYVDHSDILYDLASQMVEYLQSYLSEEDEILNVLQYYRKELANIIHTQMQEYYKRGYTEYDVIVTRGFERPKMASVTYDAKEKTRHFRMKVEEPLMIRGMLFQGFSKCIYPVQKFHSVTEQKFAILLEDEKEVQKWYKPAREDLKIYYATDRTYEPDFVVETTNSKLLCEPKMEKEMTSDDVLEKTKAAVKWCERATEHELQHDGKPWKYILIPHNAIKPSSTLSGLITRFEKLESDEL